jgi:(p)ppGpp synthase/HD superfamily hydrolase
VTWEALILVSRAADYAARAHADQHRKGVAKEPYVNHLAEVALLLAEATRGADAELVAAGWLHDTVEDTPTEREDVAELFGEAVAALVIEVTDDKTLAKAERKRLQIEHMAGLSERAQRLKIADKTSNLRAIAASPPAGWSRERMSEYVDWAEAVVGRRTISDALLEEQFARAVTHAREAVDKLEHEG